MMADVSRKMKRLTAHLERAGARVRRSPDGWVVYLDTDTAPLILHTSPKNPTTALRRIRARVESAGHTWPRSL